MALVGKVGLSAFTQVVYGPRAKTKKRNEEEPVWNIQMILLKSQQASPSKEYI